MWEKDDKAALMAGTHTIPAGALSKADEPCHRHIGVSCVAPSAYNKVTTCLAQCRNRG